MRPLHALSAAMVVAAIVVVATVASSREDHPSADSVSGGSTLSMTRFYGGTIGVRVGTFPGTLVCLRCDLKPGPSAAGECAREGHRHALSMEGDSMIHPLLASDEQILAQINSAALHGQQVSVHGAYYPSTGAILVDRIAAAQ